MSVITATIQFSCFNYVLNCYICCTFQEFVLTVPLVYVPNTPLSWKRCPNFAVPLYIILTHNLILDQGGDHSTICTVHDIVYCTHSSTCYIRCIYMHDIVKSMHNNNNKPHYYISLCTLNYTMLQMGLFSYNQLNAHE